MRLSDAVLNPPHFPIFSETIEGQMQSGAWCQFFQCTLLAYIIREVMLKLVFTNAVLF